MNGLNALNDTDRDLLRRDWNDFSIQYACDTEQTQITSDDFRVVCEYGKNGAHDNYSLFPITTGNRSIFLLYNCFYCELQ